MASPGQQPIDDITMSPSPFADIPSRPMRVKILYTFDIDSKVNCLARVPEVLNIPSVPIDEEQQIGLIELRQCIRAIVAASPELIARLGQGDFTIYAYDYSEYEVPLVGQGMLSSVLATMPPSSNALAQQANAMITGRVCRNVLAVFSGSTAETLEVKLRLVPVPRPAQSNQVKSMEMYKTLSPAMSGGFDPNAWADFNSDGHLVENLEQQSQDYAVPGSGRNSRMGHRDRRMSNASVNNISTNRQHVSRPSSRASVRSERPTWSRNDSMSGNTTEGLTEDGPARKRAKIMQADWKGKSTFGGSADSLRVTASSAASVRLHKPVARRPDLVSQHSLEPPPRVPTPLPLNDQALSRAKSLQASFMRRESSLIQAQTPQSPYDNMSDAVMSSPEGSTGGGTAEGSPVDFPSSPPAMPESCMLPEPSSPTLPTLPTMPRGADSGYMSGGAFDEMQEDDKKNADNRQRQGATRKRGRPALSTQMSDMSVVNFIDETPGPPELLPATMNTAALVAEAARNERRQSLLPPRPLPLPNAQSFVSVNSVASPAASGAVDHDGLPKLSIETSSTAQYDQTTGMGHPSGLAFPDVRHSMSMDLAYPTDGATKPTRSTVDHFEAASPAPSESILNKKQRSGGGAKRKKVIKDKLLDSLANGQMPQYCSNCGSIETPTWRSLHVRTVEGAPEDNEADDIEGDSAGIEILERDEQTKKVLRYRVIRSAQRKRDVDQTIYQTIQVCNPCGLWFNKFRYMRPAEKWNRAKATVKTSKKVESRSDAMEPPSDFAPSDFPNSDFPQSELWNDAGFAEDTPMPDMSADDSGDGGDQCTTTSVEPPQSGGVDKPSDDVGQSQDGTTAIQPAQQLSTVRPRANSADARLRAVARQKQWPEADFDAALQRAIQSSPAHFLGTEESPIELGDDLTPRPTRRLLFPSPRRPGEVKSLGDSCLASNKPGSATAQGSKGSDKLSTPSKVYNTVDHFIGVSLTGNKENLTPQFLVDDDFSRLFSPSIFKTPLKAISANAVRTPPSKSAATFEAFIATTPTPGRRVQSGGATAQQQANRTPGRTMDEFLPSFSSAERRELLGTPSRYMPGGSLSTPSRGSSHSMSHNGVPLLEMTPFTRSLTQLLEDNPGSLDFGSDAFFGHGGAGSSSSDHGAHPGPSFLFSPGSLGLLPGAGAGSGVGDGVTFSSPNRALDWALLATPKKASPLAKGAANSAKDDVVIKVEEDRAEGSR